LLPTRSLQFPPNGWSLNRITICNRTRPVATLHRARERRRAARGSLGRNRRWTTCRARRAPTRAARAAAAQRRRVPCLVRIDLAAERLPVEQCRASAHHGARLELPPPCCVPSR
jgi:antitoxin (DNA-binding transcriptional repressor) of toxin-antitoxin stability system